MAKLLVPFVKIDEHLRRVKASLDALSIERGGSIGIAELASAAPLYDGPLRGMSGIGAAPIAAGRVQRITFDNGCIIVLAKISDNGEWEKILGGLYRAFLLSIEAVEHENLSGGIEIKNVFLSDASSEVRELEMADRMGALAKNDSHQTHQTALFAMKEVLKNPIRTSYAEGANFGRPVLITRKPGDGNDRRF
jgi:hypothetical protein